MPYVKHNANSWEIFSPPHHIWISHPKWWLLGIIPVIVTEYGQPLKA